jgi:hypothetical protein
MMATFNRKHSRNDVRAPQATAPGLSWLTSRGVQWLWFVFAESKPGVPAARRPLFGSVRRKYGGQEESDEEKGCQEVREEKGSPQEEVACSR